MYRKATLIAFGMSFMGMLAYVIYTADPVTQGAVWPLCFSALITLLLPYDRLDADLFVRVIEAFKKPKA